MWIKTYSSRHSSSTSSTLNLLGFVCVLPWIPDRLPPAQPSRFLHLREHEYDKTRGNARLWRIFDKETTHEEPRGWIKRLRNLKLKFQSQHSSGRAMEVTWNNSFTLWVRQKICNLWRSRTHSRDYHPQYKEVLVEFKPFSIYGGGAPRIFTYLLEAVFVFLLFLLCLLSYRSVNITLRQTITLFHSHVKMFRCSGRLFCLMSMRMFFSYCPASNVHVLCHNLKSVWRFMLTEPRVCVKVVKVKIRKSLFDFWNSSNVERTAPHNK